jgi:hypothetical protein
LSGIRPPHPTQAQNFQEYVLPKLDLGSVDARNLLSLTLRERQIPHFVRDGTHITVSRDLSMTIPVPASTDGAREHLTWLALHRGTFLLTQAMPEIQERALD